jgi:hypothetical protein
MHRLQGRQGEGRHDQGYSWGLGPRQRQRQDAAAYAGAVRDRLSRRLGLVAAVMPFALRGRTKDTQVEYPLAIQGALALQVPLLVVRPDAALKLNKMRIQQPSMAPGSADQARGSHAS